MVASPAMMSRFRFSCRAHAIVLLTLQCAASACVDLSTTPVRHQERMSLWVQTLEPADVTDALRFCADHQLNLNVNMMQGEWDASRLASLCEQAAAADVAVRLWPALPHADGYWANQENADRFVGYIDELVVVAREHCRRVDGLIVDMELPFDKAMALEQKRAAGESNLDLVNWLLEGVDEGRFYAARALYADAVDRIKAEGLFVGVSTLAQNLDDYDDGDETIARAMWTPIEGIAWDQVAFQVYRNLFQAGYPPEDGSVYTPGLIASYAQSARAAYGERGALDLGMAGSGPRLEDGLGSAAELQADIAAAQAEGLAPGSLSIFALDGLRGVPDADAWVQVPPPAEATPSGADLDLRGIFRLLDDLDL
ncbi:MAG: hypothetical protein ACO3JL_06850 [Myxococcota bacterium]